MMNKKNILITGSSQGIGLAIAKHFAANHNVYISGRYEDKLKKLCEENKFAGYCAIDFTDFNAAEKLHMQLGVNIDILINNAGVYYYSAIENMKKEDIQTSVKINMLAPYELSKFCIPYMKQQKWCRIINKCSMSCVLL